MAAMIPVPATSLEYKTGAWSTVQPEIDKQNCIKCLLCWVYCPDGAIKRLEDDSVEVDYEYCKGCGICSTICPVKAISMKEV
ncbi:MAG TPA: 4Fe-4S dicluster domain-containing protein [Nitrososphaeria archaeon]|nr:4Fe-4S dicluster domain-containing protein [Nitrososphaeria archaeon]